MGADRIIALQDALALPFTGFDLVLERATVWPRGIAVLQPGAAPLVLTNLQRGLGAALQREGVALEARPWQPHVTLARRAEGAAPPDDGRALRWRVRGYALVESRLGSNGGYRVLQRYH